MGDTGNVAIGHADRDTLLAALDSAIEEAEGAVEAIETIRDGDDLKAALAAVEKGVDYGYKAATADDPAVLGTARGVGESVAMDVAMDAKGGSAWPRTTAPLNGVNDLTNLKRKPTGYRRDRPDPSMRMRGSTSSTVPFP